MASGIQTPERLDPALPADAATSGLIGPDGQPLESPQLKRERQQQAIRNLFERYATEYLCKAATRVLRESTKQTTLRLVGARPMITGPERLSALTARQLRERFLETSVKPPAWVNDPHKPIGKRARREITREFQQRPRHLCHRAASQIINDIEYAGYVMEGWRNAFGEARNAAEQQASGGDDRSADAGAPPPEEAARQGDVSLGDAPDESPAAQS